MTGVADEQLRRRGTDWIAARDFWLALPPPRSSEAVAKRVGVSSTRVRFVARRDGWQAIADGIDARTLAAVTKRIVRSRTERDEVFLDLFDKILDRAAEQVAKPDSDVPLAVVPQFGRHAQLVLGEATDRPDQAEVQEALGIVIALAVAELPRKAQGAFLAKVRARLGAIGGDE